MSGDLEIHHLIRAARTARRMSLRTLAAITGLTPSFLSQFERGKCGANETTIARICDGLGLCYSNVSTGRRLQHSIIRNDIIHGVHMAGDNYSVSLDRFPRGSLQVDTIALRPGVRTLLGGDHASHAIRYLIVTSGRIELCSDRKCLPLGEGDTFECFTGHQIQISSIDQQEVRLICIFSPSSYPG